MTFQAYHRARRMGLALLDIRKGKTVLDSQLDQGFESGSGFREAFARLVGAAPSRARDIGVLHAKWLETPLGADARAGRRSRPASARLRRPPRPRARAGDAAEAPVRARAARRASFPRADRSASLPSTSPARDGRSRLRSRSPDRRSRCACGKRCRRFRPGHTWSYAELARRIGQPSAVRAVGRANGDNRLSIIVPCHRVIGADGALTGYGGGLARKQKLLDLEREAGAGQPRHTRMRIRQATHRMRDDGSDPDCAPESR